MSSQDHKGSSRDDMEAVLRGGNRPGISGMLGRHRWGVVILLVVGVAAAIYLLAGSGDGARIEYRTDPATRGNIVVIVTATGTVQPTKKVEISSELSGIIRTVKVDYNTKVKVGQILAELDTDRLKATVASARAKLAATRARVVEAEATLAEKRSELERKQQLADRAVASGQDLDTARASFRRAEAALASAQADIEVAQADLDLSETNLDKTCICSPINGVVLDRSVDPGQVVAASLQAPVLFTIAEDLTQMEVQVDVDEADVGKVHEGQAATFTVDAHPGRSFGARIKQLRFGSEIVQGVVTYRAVLSTDNSQLLLRPGMTATAEIEIHRAEDVLTVLNEALRYAPPAEQPKDGRSLLQKLLPRMPQFRPPSRQDLSGPARRLWVLRNGEGVPVEVTVGASDGRRTEITQGSLEPGQAVIVDTIASSR